MGFWDWIGLNSVTIVGHKVKTIYFEAKEGLLKSLIFCHGSLAQPDFGRLWPEKEPGQ